VSLGDTSAEAREKQAKRLFEYANKSNISGTTQVTDSLGYASFAELEEGIYLIAQIGNVECGTDKFESAPFLVNIPSEFNGKTEYDVVIEPKGEWVTPAKPPVTPTNPDKPAPTEPTPTKPDIPDPIRKIIDSVKTGDTTNIISWVLIAIGSLVLIIVLYRKRKEN
jgi:LPXTG-motif cell wall-anchored protein